MRMKRTHLLRTSLVLLSLVFTAFALSPVSYQFDISDYVYGVDHDLQARARAAVEAERFVRQSNRRIQDRAAEEPCRVQSEGPCPPSKYRTPTGVCNNVRHPSWGARGSPYIKALPAAYSNGFSSPRQSVTSHSLPSAIEVVTKAKEVAKTTEAHEALTSLAGIWSELLLRDISQPVYSQNLPECCESCDKKHPECYEAVDTKGQVVNYHRAVPSIGSHRCQYDARDQMNAASGYLDASDIYGNSDEKLHQLRTYDHGKVNLFACELCNKSDSALSLMYSAILREHNRIADELFQANKHWDDTRLFLESRRAVVAQLQHITFNEFIPSILGGIASADPTLTPAVGFYNGYSSKNLPGALDAVAFAALQAAATMKRESEGWRATIEEQVTAPARKVNLDVPAFSHPQWDPSALLVHMSRDHGIPAYVEFVSYCTGGKVKVTNFTDLTQFMEVKNIELLERIYSDVRDVDLLLGGILETSTQQAIAGPTFVCLLREQFIKLRNSDRFWYENDIPPSSLTAGQLAEIRKVSLAGILCANSGVSKVQPKALIQEDPYLNIKISCEQHTPLDLSQWTEFSNEETVMMANEMSEPTSESSAEVDIPELTPDIIAEAVKKAEADLIARKQLEYNSWLRQRYVDPKSPAGTAASFSKANKGALLLANSSILYELATNEIINGVHSLRRRKRQAFDPSDNVLNFPTPDFTDLLQNVDVAGFIPNKKATNHEEVDCPVEEGPCDPTTPFRSYSGHCNNLRNPNLGKSLTTFARLLPPAYDDGVSKPRSVSVTGAPLPNPRVVSTVMHPDISNLHNRYTLMVMQFAQFLDHDLTMTPIHKGFAESIPSCRDCDSAKTVHPECNPFPIPPGDHFFPTVNISSGARLCFPSMRSLPGQQRLGPREQVNQNTGFLDGSVIYGENRCICDILRSFNGRMNTTAHPNRGRELLPQSATHPECKAPSGYCFIGGDGRASEQPALTVMHTMWIRKHNALMDGLQAVNPHWDGEKIFQESRRITVAMLQHITYNEFLPRILGWNAVSLYGLKLLPQGYYKEYSPTCNPSMLNEFATAAYRIGHSLLRPHLPRMDSNYKNIDPPILLRDGFFNPDMLYQNGMVDEMIRGLMATPMETLDQFITGEVTNHLFEQKGIPHSGIDLIALNVHRGREHGLPGYNNYRALCNLKRATTFEDLSREMAPEVIARLKRVYASVDDIDLFPGGMSERPLQGGLVGPTFACIIAIQFRQLRKCDRFWYETDDPNLRFTEPQLAEIRKTTLTEIMCSNMDHDNMMQRAAFDLPSNFLNPRVPCQSIARMNFNVFKETKNGCNIGGRNVAVGESGFPTPCTSCVCTTEGTQCASLRVTDCNRLIREASREAILRDDVCTSQCGFVLTEPLGRNTRGNFPGPTFGSRPREAALLSPFSGFKLPDLSEFLG